MQEIKKRKRLRLDEWRQVVERFDRSGHCVSEFCKREGLCVSSFKRWHPRVQAKCSELTGRGSVVPDGFVDLGSIARVSDASRLEVRLDLGAGLTLRIVRG
jgi:hypothetical protein